MQSEDELRAHAAVRLRILDAMVVAIEHRAEMLEIVATSPHADEARINVMKRFGLDEIQAVAILDLQVRRFAELERGRILAERNEIRASLHLDR